MAPLTGDSGFASNTEFEARNILDNVEIGAPALGIPSEIRVVAPDLPRVIKVEHNLPNKIEVVNVDIPSKIEIEMRTAIPETIRLIPDDIPTRIMLMATDVPKTIDLVPRGLPESIKLEVPNDLIMKLDVSDLPTTIKVTGVPDTITLIHNLPDEIFLRKPNDLTIPVVQTSPFDVNVKVDFTLAQLVGEKQEGQQCVMIVPCRGPET
jgi:hypothetical protein